MREYPRVGQVRSPPAELVAWGALGKASQRLPEDCGSAIESAQRVCVLVAGKSSRVDCPEVGALFRAPTYPKAPTTGSGNAKSWRCQHTPLWTQAGVHLVGLTSPNSPLFTFEALCA